jgi:hypothetical protein
LVRLGYKPPKWKEGKHAAVLWGPPGSSRPNTKRPHALILMRGKLSSAMPTASSKQEAGAA